MTFLGEGISVIKGSEFRDILRYRGTNGINHGVNTNDIINKLLDWHVPEILGAGRDWVTFDFGRFLDDEVAFAHTINEFCPDITEHNLGSIENLVDYLSVSTVTKLWWDQFESTPYNDKATNPCSAPTLLTTLTNRCLIPSSNKWNKWGQSKL